MPMNVYTKEEIDALLAKNVYTKGEVDALLAKIPATSPPSSTPPSTEPIKPIAGAKSFPLLAGMLIGTPHNYYDTAYQAQIAKLDLAIIQLWKGYNNGGKNIPTTVNQIKALNPNLLLGNYTLFPHIYNNPANTASADQYNKMFAEKGPGGVGDWWARDSAGNVVDFSNGTYGTWDANITHFVTPDANGDRVPQWIAKRDNTHVISGINWDIWYSDNNFWKPRSNPDWNRNGANDDQNSPTVQGWWRAGQRAHYDTMKALQPNKLIIVNADNDLSGNFHHPSAEPFSEYKNVVHGAFLEHIIGMSWSAETWGGWSTMMNWYHETFKNLLDPKIVHFNIKMGTTPNYQLLRYGLGACLMNNGYFDATLGNYNPVAWYDEYDNAGAGKHWLGAPIDPPQTTAWNSGVYRREFQNGLVLANPKGNGSRTVTVGPGFHRIKGTQAPTVNNGAAVTSTVTLADRDGLLLVRN